MEVKLGAELKRRFFPATFASVVMRWVSAKHLETVLTATEAV